MQVVHWAFTSEPVAIFMPLTIFCELSSFTAAGARCPYTRCQSSRLRSVTVGNAMVGLAECVDGIGVTFAMAYTPPMLRQCPNLVPLLLMSSASMEFGRKLVRLPAL